MTPPNPQARAAEHLTPEHWSQANRLLVRKALAEFSHERLCTPTPLGADHYSVASDDGSVEYRFRASVLSLEHWQIDLASITRHRDGTECELDALDFVLDLRETLGLGEDVLPTYLEEITSTLASTAFKLSQPRPRAAELAKADFQSIETGMTEGHPCFVANNGRLGFGIGDYRSYAPEAASPVRLVWLAVRRDHSTFAASAGFDYDQLLAEELDPATLERFQRQLTDLGLDLADYHLIPAHPWQWWNRLAVTFAADVARRVIVCLGEGDDDYLAQQSIRTFFNTSRPHRHYVKTALSVLNMGFLRGLSTNYMSVTPAINDWVHELVSNDPVFARYGFSILRERAAVGYRPQQYEASAAKGSPYLKMFAALWRESPIAGLRGSERVATMASLLHTDLDGSSLVGGLIAESGLEPVTWLRRYLDVYLPPLLHSLYAYDVAFMPHGENIILVLDQGVPTRAFMKDIGEEVVVMNDTTPLPPEVERIRADVPEIVRVLSLFTDVVDCYFRFLNAILVEEGLVSDEEFWSTVAASVRDYQSEHPEFADRFKRDDLFAAEFPLSCLNRLQLRNNKQMVDLSDPAGALQLVGTLANPLARFAAD